MDRHVIKGRGENRGKYLCYARMAGLPPEAGYVWLPEQHRAARWEDPRYSGRAHATNVAAERNGYFVKLVAPATLTESIVRELQAFIAGQAAGAKEPLRCYWFDGDFHEAGENFCRACAEQLVDRKHAEDPGRFAELYGEIEDAEERYRAAIDGGFDIEHDSPPYCETCGAKLSGLLTDYGADRQIEALTSDCAPTFDDVEDWAALGRAIVNLSDDDPRWRAISRVAEAARVAEREEAEQEAAIAAAPGMAMDRERLTPDGAPGRDATA